MKGCRLTLTVCFVLCVVSLARADETPVIDQKAEEPPLANQAATKFARGAANFATGWMEMPRQIYLVGHREGWLTGIFRGPIDGLGMVGARTIAGMYEVLTFPVPVPPRYQPVMKPDYVWQPEPAAPGD
jgi:putative exosortase-associated protein (TIGR04073 family)